MDIGMLPASALTIDPIWENGSVFYRVTKFDVELDPITGNEVRAVSDIFHCNTWEIAREVITVNYRGS